MKAFRSNLNKCIVYMTENELRQEIEIILVGFYLKLSWNKLNETFLKWLNIFIASPKRYKVFKINLIADKWHHFIHVSSVLYNLCWFILCMLSYYFYNIYYIFITFFIFFVLLSLRFLIWCLKVKEKIRRKKIQK